MRRTTQPVQHKQRAANFLCLILILTTACADDQRSPREMQNQADSQLSDGSLMSSMDSGVDSADGLTGSTEDAGSDTEQSPRSAIDLNDDGTIKILLLGSSRGIEANRPGFAVDDIAIKLQTLLESADTVNSSVIVAAEDLYRTKQLDTGYGQGGDVYNWAYYCHSLMQYLVWPDDLEQRRQALRGLADHDWDHVIVTGDPGIILKTPGFHALGVHELATLVDEGDAQLHLLVGWTNQPDDQERLSRAADIIQANARFEIGLIPAANAWWAIPDTLRDSGPDHPSENGAKLAAATILSHFLDRPVSVGATGSDLDLYSAAFDAVQTRRESAIAGPNELGARPFAPAGISARKLHFNHTGTSSENGILRGLRWVTAQGRVALERGGNAPIHFNYGRANPSSRPTSAIESPRTNLIIHWASQCKTIPTTAISPCSMALTNVAVTMRTGPISALLAKCPATMNSPTLERFRFVPSTHV